MSRWCRWWAVLVILGSGVARGADVTPGFGASLRLGYGAPMGKVTAGPNGDLASAFSGQVPIQVDLGYRVTPQLTLAVYGQYARSFVAERVGCDQPEVRCSAASLRGGVEVFWRFLPGRALDPWVGCGTGYEWS